MILPAFKLKVVDGDVRDGRANGPAIPFQFGWFVGLGVTQGHWKHRHLIERIRLPIPL